MAPEGFVGRVTPAMALRSYSLPDLPAPVCAPSLVLRAARSNRRELSDLALAPGLVKASIRSQILRQADAHLAECRAEGDPMRFPDLFHSLLASGRRFILAASIAMFVAIPSAIAGGPKPASVVGKYDGGQMEVAAALELTANGRFHYALSYGALDKEAAGKWTMNGSQITLTSDPVTAPRYVIVSQERGPEGVLRIIMDFEDPYYQQHFFALITTSNGSVDNVQLGIDGLNWPFQTGAPPNSVRLLFNVYQLVSDPLPLAPSPGYLIHYRFEPNDLGKVEFKAEHVKVVHGELLLERHGRTLRFKRVNS
jgi:hypothetical protein